MTTSGTVSYNPAFVDIASRVMRQCGVNNETQTASASQLAVLLPAANSMVKEWEATGIHVWLESEAILFLQPGQQLYTLGPDSTDHACDVNSYVAPTLASAVGAGSSSLTLSSATGIAAGSYIGVFLDNGSTFWTTASGSPVGAVVSLTAPLPAATSAQAGNFVFAYTQTTPCIQRPLKVPGARLRYFQGQNGPRDTPLRPYARQQYMDLPNKQNPGPVTAYFYAPLMNDGQMNLWQNPQITGVQNAQAVPFTWYRQIQDFNATNNTLDAPQEWVNSMAWCLSREVGLEFSVTEKRWAIIEKMAAEKFQMLQDWDRASEDVQFGFGWDGLAEGWS